MEQQTYEEILSRMEASFEEKSGIVVRDASDFGIRMKVLAGEVYNLAHSIDWLKRQAFPQTASGEFLESHASERGITRLESTPASGTLTFRREKALNYSLPIPKGTVCALADDPSIRFVTTEPSSLDAMTVSVTVPAQSEQSGSETNAAAGRITKLVTPPTGIEAVTNESPFTGGQEREEDAMLRKRLLESYRDPGNGANCGYYRELALSCEAVYSASVVARSDQNDAVTVYVCGRDGGLDAATLAKVQTLIEAKKELGVTVLVRNAIEKTVSFGCEVKPAAGYSFTQVQEPCRKIVSEYIGSLCIGEPMLVMEAVRRLLSSGLLENCTLSPYTVDETALRSQRIVAQSVLVAELA